MSNTNIKDINKRREDKDNGDSIVNKIIEYINENIQDDEKIKEDELNDTYGDMFTLLKNNVKELYNLQYINCKQPIYEIEKNYFNNLMYKFTYEIINNYSIQTNILEGIQVVKNPSLYTLKDNEIQFTQKDIIAQNINRIFQKSMEYSYIKEKNIIDYFINWNNNKYIDININKIDDSIDNEYNIEELDSDLVELELELELDTVPFLHNIMIKDEEHTNKDEYLIEIIDSEPVLLE